MTTSASPASSLASRLALWPSLLRALAAVSGLIALDQLSKWWVFEVLLRVGGETRPFFDWLLTVRHWSVYDDPAHFAERLLTPFANLVMVWNRGVSFGLFSGTGGDNPYILVGVAAVIVAVLLVWLARTRDAWMRAALILIIAGAIANVHDRLRFGAVADFLDLHVAGYHWPAFNVADSAIVVGAVLLALDALNWRPHHTETTKTEG